MREAWVRTSTWREFFEEPELTEIERRSAVGGDSVLGLNALGSFDRVTTERTPKGVEIDYCCRGCGKNITFRVPYLEMLAVACARWSPDLAFAALGLTWSEADWGKRQSGASWLGSLWGGERRWAPVIREPWHSRCFHEAVPSFGEDEAMGHVRYALRRGLIGPRSVIDWFAGRAAEGREQDGLLRLGLAVLRLKLKAVLQDDAWARWKAGRSHGQPTESAPPRPISREEIDDASAAAAQEDIDAAANALDLAEAVAARPVPEEPEPKP